MCPIRLFSEKKKLAVHLTKYHEPFEAGAISTKLQADVAARWDYSVVKSCAGKLFGRIGGPTEGNFVSQGAKRMRQDLRQSPSWKRRAGDLARQGHNFDRAVTILLDVEHTRYILKEDAERYHKVSNKFRCTDRFLNAFLAALIHPVTKGAKKRVVSFLAERSADRAYLLPRNSSIYHTLLEKLMEHESVIAAMHRCRNACDVRVLGIDGAYKSMMTVLYQVPHGASKAGSDPLGAPGLHVLLTVQCQDSILNVHGAPSEDQCHQVAALRGAVSAEHASRVLMICSDNPINLGGLAQLRVIFKNLKCISKDLLHIALKVEKASGDRRTKLSEAIRRCLSKLRLGCCATEPYHCKDSSASRPSQLPAIMAPMGVGEARFKTTRISWDCYLGFPYDSMSDFVEDIAAPCLAHPEMLRRSAGSGTTVIGSLKRATSSIELGYIQNFCKFVAMHPGMDVIFGTTRNEAFHLQLKAFYRNVMHQTARHARCVANVATLVKLLAGYFCQSQNNLVQSIPEKDLLRMIAEYLLTDTPISSSTMLSVEAVQNPKVDVSKLPPNAKKLRKRSRLA